VVTQKAGCSAVLSGVVLAVEYGPVMDFAETLTTMDELRSVIAPPSELVTAKEVTALDDYCRDFIARSPFVLIASSDGQGSIDVSPKGDPAGFVRVLDDNTIAIPDRPGNHRADTFVNVIRHPYVGLIFLIPGTKNTLRVRGRATIVRDLDLRESMAIKGQIPEVALVVDVTTAFFHCAKCIIRSGLWKTDEAQAALESDQRLLAETMVKHGELSLTVDQMQEIILSDESERLY
jgi:PPOX class probable FMN-dependent enzyme